jgi:hypothetical protein
MTLASRTHLLFEKYFLITYIYIEYKKNEYDNYYKKIEIEETQGKNLIFV